MKIKSFTDFLTEAENNTSLKKIYLATKRSSGQQWLTYKGFAGNKFFIQITENNLDKLDINPEYPVLNYHGDIINELLDKNLIKKENVYNQSEYIKLSGSKKEFHKKVNGDENIPITVFSKKDAKEKLNFPIIAKPANGHSGIGISVIKTESELDDLNESEYDVYSEFINKKEEMRFFLFKGDVINWLERQPMNSKAKSGSGEAKEKMNFKYILRNVNDIPNDYQKVLTKFATKFNKLPYICFDVMKSTDDKIYIIESNTQPGVPFDVTVQLYRAIYKDFYKEPINPEDDKKLKQYSSEMIDMTIKKDKERFSVNN